MPLSSGTYTIGPQNGRMTVRTYREGIGSRVGHDLVLEVGQWNGTATVDTGNPSASTLTLTADPRSFRVVEGTGGVKPLSDKDRREILKNLEDKVLDASKHPEISFRSTSISGDEGRATITGDLTIAGTTRPVTVEVTGEDTPGGVRIAGTIAVAQTQWGIKPYSALLGALKVRDTVEIEVEATLSSP